MKIESIWQHKGVQWFGKYAAFAVAIGGFSWMPAKRGEDISFFDRALSIIGVFIVIGSFIFVFWKAYRDKKAVLSILENPQELCVNINECRLERTDVSGNQRLYELFYNCEIDEKIYMFCTKIGVKGKDKNTVEHLITAGTQISFIYNKDNPEKYFCKKPQALERFDTMLTRWTDEKQGQGWYIFALILFLSILFKEYLF